jgi:DNA-binding FrmR family transcriptional regulator
MEEDAVGANRSLPSMSSFASREEHLMMDEQDRRDLSHRLSRIEGQARGIKKMVDEGQDAAAILVQFMALQKATRSAATSLVKAQAIDRIRGQIREALATCPGACDHCDELVAIDRALAELDFDALLQTHLKVSE